MARHTKTTEVAQFTLFKNEEPANAFKKAVQIVHSKPSAPLSLLQGKLSNCLLKNALDTEPDKEGWWTISIMEMGGAIGFDSNNRAYLRNSALELMKIVFEYDVISKSNTRVLWKASVLFPDMEIQESVMRYQISGQLRDRVLNPDMYALIDLNVLRRFQRSASIPIYEHCIRFINLGKTAVVQLETFRDIVLGANSGAGSYKEYKYFKQKVLRPSIVEINTLSEITIELVEGKIGRSVDSIHFLVKRKPSSEVTSPRSDEIIKITDELVQFGLSAIDVRRLVKQHTPNELRAALEYTRKQSRVDNPLGYFRKALENGWGIVDVEPPIEVKLSATDPADKGAKKSIEDVYRVHQIKEAQSYFNGIDGDDQDLLVTQYNEQQTTASLKFKKERQTKIAQTGFFAWLVTEKWGTPTSDQLLEFASVMLSNRELN